MKLESLFIISEPGKIYNEDIAGATKISAWVLDGQTGLVNKKYTDGDTDAKWYVEQWNKYLYKNADNLGRSLAEIIKSGIKEVRELFYTVCTEKDLGKEATPSATIAITRVKGEVLEYFVLGDISLYIEYLSKHQIEIVDKRQEPDDNRNKNLMAEYIAIGKSISEAGECIADFLIATRRKKNTPGAYWVLEFDETAVDHAVTGSANILAGINVIMMSDGFGALKDTYNKVTRWDLLAYFNSYRGRETYELLRKIEKDDESCKQYPRFKISDDATFLSYYISNIEYAIDLLVRKLAENEQFAEIYYSDNSVDKGYLYIVNGEVGIYPYKGCGFSASLRTAKITKVIDAKGTVLFG